MEGVNTIISEGETVATVSTPIIDNTKIRIATYNSKGHGTDRIDYMKQLLYSNDVLFIQEHWYFESGITDFEAQLDGFSVLGISGIDESEVLLGRPYGGCAIIYNNRLKCSILPVALDSRRCMACVVTINGVKLLFINVYMPCDVNVNAFEVAYNDVLHDIESCINYYADI